MTISTAALPQSSVSSQNESSDKPIAPTLALLTERGYSDSAVPSSRMSANKQQGILCHDSPALTSPPLAPTGQSDSTEVTPSPLRRKAIQDLRLPSFRALGIAAPIPHPAALLTPPDEPALPDISVPSVNCSVQPRSHSVPRTTMPQTPEGLDTDSTPTPTAQDATPRQEAISNPEPGVQQADTEPLSNPVFEVSGPQEFLAPWSYESITTLGGPNFVFNPKSRADQDSRIGHSR